MDYSYARKVIGLLQKRYGKHPRTRLRHKNMTELFVSVLLSPQCNDNQVNKVTKNLFSKYKTFGDYANADLAALQNKLDGLNYYKTKARHLQEASRMIIERFHGRIPKTTRELMELNGVGKKVANVILNEGYGINEGIAVDTHCGRVAVRLGLSRHKDPLKIEQDLLKKVPVEEWGRTSNLFIELGRDTCKARDRECYRCVLKVICPSSLSRSQSKQEQTRICK